MTKLLGRLCSATAAASAAANAVVSASDVEVNESANDLMMLRSVSAPCKDLMHPLSIFIFLRCMTYTVIAFNTYFSTVNLEGIHLLLV